MAEHFYDVHHTVHFSNGATEKLFKGWIEVALGLQQTSSLKEVILFLENRLTDFEDGWRAFSLIPDTSDYPQIFHSADHLKTFADIVKYFAYELTKEEPNLKTCDIDWDTNLRMLWLVRMIALHKIIRELVLLKNIDIEELFLKLNSSDSLLCKYYLVRDEYYEFCKREKRWTKSTDKFLEKKLDYLTQLIIIIHQQHREFSNYDRLRFFSDRAEVYISLSRKQEAINDLKLALLFEEADEGKELILEYIDELSERKIK